MRLNLRGSAFYLAWGRAQVLTPPDLPSFGFSIKNCKVNGCLPLKDCIGYVVFLVEAIHLS
jgi:hypothetical protein